MNLIHGVFIATINGVKGVLALRGLEGLGTRLVFIFIFKLLSVLKLLASFLSLIWVSK